jgi:hypothetical protein
MRKAGGYTQAEDFLIRDLVEEMGPQFVEIANCYRGEQQAITLFLRIGHFTLVSW